MYAAAWMQLFPMSTLVKERRDADSPEMDQRILWLVAWMEDILTLDNSCVSHIDYHCVVASYRYDFFPL